MSSGSERRKYARFKVGDGAFAFVDNVPFTIRNISKGGMKLQTVVFDEPTPEEMVLDIFLQNENFYMQSIPVKVVRFQNNSASSPFSTVHVKCFGLQFGELTEQQKTRLDYFITRCTMAES